MAVRVATGARAWSPVWGEGPAVFSAVWQSSKLLVPYSPLAFAFVLRKPGAAIQEKGVICIVHCAQLQPASEIAAFESGHVQVALSLQCSDQGCSKGQFQCHYFHLHLSEPPFHPHLQQKPHSNGGRSLLSSQTAEPGAIDRSVKRRSFVLC